MYDTILGTFSTPGLAAEDMEEERSVSQRLGGISQKPWIRKAGTFQR